MDLGQLDSVTTFLAWAVRVIEYAGAALLLLFAGWCGLMESTALIARVLKTLLGYAHARTVHARDAVRSVRDEMRSWRSE
jgi:hypothetical protein